ncbi:MAG TPA: hypothetical protein PKE04_02670, partial [Clostridia bacterium]|nr:hypothetical protein [Clostridia bacterium]
MQDQNRLLESALSYRLIHGSLPEDELNSMLSFASRDLFSQAYLGVLIDICGEGDERRLQKSSAVIEELLGRIVPSVGFTVALSSRRMAVLYLRREPDGEDAVPFFTTLYRLLREQYGINTCFWVGKEVRTLNDAHESFQSATHLADASAQDGARYIVTYAHPLYSAGSFHYGRAEAGELECLVKAGRLEELLSALGRIRAANLNRISVFQGKLLLCALTDTLLRASEEILRMPEDAEEKAQLDRMLPAIPEGALPWGFGQLERCFTLLCQVAVARKKSHNAELAGRVRAYVEAHC